MIITDLDNTLLRSDKTISAYTVDVFKRCQAKGIKIVFATARSLQGTARTLEQFMPDINVCYGGALAMAGDETIHRAAIPVDISLGIIKECLKAPEIYSILAINESIALTNNKKALEARETSHYKYDDFSTGYDNTYLKISINSTSPVVAGNIAARFPMCDMLRYTGEDLYRFANRNAVKWNAIRAIAEYYGTSADTFIAFGDDVNDAEMITKCGTGVAVANAVDEVKSAARHICASNDEDGVAKWLEHNIL